MPVGLRAQTNVTPVCDECPGRCCTRKFYTHLLLNPAEAEREPFAQHVVHGNLLMFNADGCCPFLGGDNRCRIYEKRPNACRGHICYSPDNLETHDNYKNKPTHRRLLKRWQVLPGQKYAYPPDK